MQFITTLAISAMCTVNPNARNLGALIYNDISISVEDRLASDVLLALEEDLGLLMKVYWETDDADGCDATKTISLTLRNQPAVLVLERIVNKMGKEENGATWQLRDGVVEVGLKSVLSKKSSQRLVTYPIMDLLFVVGDFSFLDQNNNKKTPQTDDEKQKQIDELIEKITLLIETEIWEQNGGTCTITNYRETLLIRAPDFVHRQIGGYAFIPSKPTGVKERQVRYGDGRTSVRRN